MERILSVAQMRSADKFTIENLGVDSDELVYRAGKGVADEILKRFLGGRVLVCVGEGNNGKDGRIIADILSKKHGFSVAVLSVSNGIFKLFDKKYDIIVDCIFGTGLNREVEGKYRTAIEKINSSGAYVVACDIASGLNGDTGRVMGVAVKANLTIAVQEYKLGHFLNDGIDYSGETVVKDIGISVWDDDCVKRLNLSDVSRLFMPRIKHVNKGDFGKVAIVGGSKIYTGSALLSANALCALKMGTGYSNLVVAESLLSVYAGKNPECLVTPVKDNDGFITFNESDFSSLLKYDSIAVGMGMGVSEETYKVVSYLISNFEGRLLIDADGLNSLAKYGLNVLKDKKCTVILTPHVGEFSRLINVDIGEILNNPIKYVKQFALEYSVLVLYKDAVSIFSNGESVYLNTTGCSGLAKAGSGDVLSGIIAGLLARVDDCIDAVVGGSFLFGLTGEWVMKEQNEYTMTASDVIGALPKVIKSLQTV